LKKQFRKLLKKDSILNLFYRGLTIIAKFLLSILIVKKLSVTELGVYGIFQTTVTLLIYLLGFDFYTYNARELIKNDQKSNDFYIGNQMIFHGLVYLVVLPLSLFIFFYKVIEINYIIYFYSILVLEHISQEIYRILIVLKKSVIASLTLFLRAGLWIMVLYLFWQMGWGKTEIEFIFNLWIIGSVLSVITGVIYLNFKPVFKIDFEWIKSGVRMAMPFLIATVFYKVIEFSGRYFIDFYWTKAEVGIFTFFSGISNAMFVFVQSMVIIVMSPYLIESSNKGKAEFQKVFKDYKKRIITTTIVGFVLACTCIYPLLLFVGNEELLQNMLVFVLLLLSVVFFCFSYIPHYGLYVYHKDRELLLSSIFGAIAIVILNFIFVPKYGVKGAAIAQVLSMFILFAAKWYMYNKFINEPARTD
jgi:O-antigen/teichoic acid export membrane protein